jgi:hypothetical protein
MQGELFAVSDCWDRLMRERRSRRRFPHVLGARTGWTGFRGRERTIGVQKVPGSYGPAAEEFPFC